MNKYIDHFKGIQQVFLKFKAGISKNKIDDDIVKLIKADFQVSILI